MKEGKLLVISGPSGVGKTEVSLGLLALGELYSKSVSATTRKMRDGEVDGVDYFFISKEKFNDMKENSQFLEFTDYNGNWYGTPRKFVEDMLAKGKVLILVIDVVGALNIKKMFPEAVMCFLNAESLEAIEKRLRNRKTDSEDSISGRLTVAKKELECSHMFDYVVMNREGEISKTVQSIDEIIKELVSKK
jgi:guanylate kinase